MLDHISKALLTPSWPVNIKRTITIFDIVFKDVVIPSDKPVTPNALQDSKKASRNVISFKIVTIIIETNRTSIWEIKVTISDFITVSCGIFLFKNVTSFLFLLYEIIAKTHTKKVVTLIPPPVEAGAEPIHISKANIILVPWLNSFMSIVENPAFLADIELNMT